MEKRKYIETILKSADAIIEVSPRDTLLDSIQLKINRMDTISKVTIWKYAASIALLISFNLIMMYSFDSKIKSQAENPENASFLVNNQLY